MYASGDQFDGVYRTGGRYDYAKRARDANQLDRGASAVLTYWPSEFSQIRGQYRFTRYAEGINANEPLGCRQSRWERRTRFRSSAETQHPASLPKLKECSWIAERIHAGFYMAALIVAALAFRACRRPQFSTS